MNVLSSSRKYLRGVDDNESFTARLIKPIYTVNRKYNMLIIYLVVLTVMYNLL